MAPTHAVSHELEGLAAENSVSPGDGIEAVKWLRTGRIETTAELMASSRGERTQYYQQTAAAFFEGLSRSKPDADMRALEIGAERSFFMLRTIRDLCSEAYALNIFFHITHENANQQWPVRVLGDMNDLPFADGHFDLVICSATLHHTATLPEAFREVARVLRPGGRAIVINEPVEGLVKSRGLDRGQQAHDRDEHIHEDPVSARQWSRAIAGSGMLPDYFVPAWFMQQVAAHESAPQDVRFARLARALAPMMRRPFVQDLGRLLGRIPGQALLGLPLNVVLWKPAV